MILYGFHQINFSRLPSIYGRDTKLPFKTHLFKLNIFKVNLKTQIK